MTIHNGSFSVSRYRVIGNNKKFTYQELNKNIKSFQAQPLRLKNVYKELDVMMGKACTGCTALKLETVTVGTCLIYVLMTASFSG